MRTDSVFDPSWIVLLMAQSYHNCTMKRQTDLVFVALAIVALAGVGLAACDTDDSTSAGSPAVTGTGASAAVGGGQSGSYFPPGGTGGSGAVPGGGAGGAVPGGGAGGAVPGGGAGGVVPGGVAGGTDGGATGGTGGTAGAPIGGASGVPAAGTGGVAGVEPFDGGPGDGGGVGGGGGAGGTGGTTGSDGGAGTGACPHVQMEGRNFLTIGDSWIQMPGTQVTRLEDYLKAAGVIGQNESFDRRERSGAPLATIVGQYNRADNSNVRVLIMDGGGIDLFVTPAGDQAAITPVVNAFEDFLQQVAADGYVEHIIYSLYPVIPSTPNLNQNMKPGFSAACAASAVDCHLVDLEPLFQGDHFSFDSTHADESGAQIIADAWWKVMQDNCIAQ